MKRIYELIKKTNQILLFFVLLAVLAMFGSPLLERLWPYQPPQVAVAQSEEEAKQSVIQDVRFLGQTSGIYVFGIVKRVINARGSEPIAALLKPTASLGSGFEENGQIVNIAFSRGDQRIRTLLKNDGLIQNFEVGERTNSIKLKANLFRCVTEDTDGNHRLDYNDRSDLYVVSEGLDKPDLVIMNVLEYQAISPTHLMAKTQEDGTLHFRDIDLETWAKSDIAWK